MASQNSKSKKWAADISSSASTSGSKSIFHEGIIGKVENNK